MTQAERQAMVLQWQPLVYKIAHKLYKQSPLARRAGSVEALVSSGNMALIDAVRLYNPDHPSRASFMTYVYKSIHQKIMRDALHENVIDLPEKVTRALADPTRLDDPFLLPARKAVTIGRLPSYFDRIQEGKEPYRLDDRYEGVAKALVRLTKQERNLVVRRFGLDNRPPQTLKQLADRRRVTKEAIRQQLLTICKKLKRYSGNDA